MKTKLVLSMLVILIAIVASVGGTMAWFTDVAETPVNTFSAGTVLINADDDFVAGGDDYTLENWNPKDCTEKIVTVEVTGTKGTLVRAQFVESWTFYNEIEETIDGKLYVKKNTVGEAIPLPEPVTVFSTDDEWVAFKGVNSDSIGVGSEGEDLGLTTGIDLSTITTMEIDTDIWTYVDESSDLDTDAQLWWYLDEVLKKGEAAYNYEMVFFTEVCFSENADNLFQGAAYTVSVVFEAIQASNNASGSQWTVDSLYDFGGAPTLMIDPATENMTAENWDSFDFYPAP